MSWADVLRVVVCIAICAVVLATAWAIADWFESRKAGR